MLKPKTFHIPGALLIEQHIVKDGPSPFFRCMEAAHLAAFLRASVTYEMAQVA